MQRPTGSCRSTATPTVTSHSAGFSLIETLIAAALLLLVALGILPMFSNAVVNNVQGNLASQVANFARAEAERLQQLAFNHAELTPPGGGTELTSKAFYSPSQHRWIAEADWDGSEDEAYTRETRVRQFSIDHIDMSSADFEFEDGEALPGSTSPDQVHLKEIQVTVESEAAMGGGKSATVRLYKSI